MEDGKLAVGRRMHVDFDDRSAKVKRGLDRRNCIFDKMMMRRIDAGGRARLARHTFLTERLVQSTMCE